MLLFKRVIHDFLDGVAKTLVMRHKQAILTGIELLRKHRSFTLTRVRIEPAALGKTQNSDIFLALRRNILDLDSASGFRLLGFGSRSTEARGGLFGSKLVNSNKVNSKLIKLRLLLVCNGARLFLLQKFRFADHQLFAVCCELLRLEALELLFVFLLKHSFEVFEK